jgi:hypothetical protein
MVKNDNETLAFRLHLCHFNNTGSIRFVNSSGSGETAFYINEMRLNAVDITPEGSAISYSSIVQSNPNPTTYTQFLPNKNIVPSTGYHQITTGTSQGGVASIDIGMNSSSDGMVSPIFDAEKSSIVTISNTINNNSVSIRGDAQYNGELDPTNTGSNYKAVARYITKKVTLDEGMEAENITVAMSVCNPKKNSSIASSVKVFVRPISVGEVNFDNTDYVELTTSDSGTSTSDTDYREVSFTNIGYTTLTKFKTFSVKIVMFGSPTGEAVPHLKNLRIIAT